MISVVEEKYERISPIMNERLRRRWAACEAMALGRGGISAVSTATGISRTTIRKAILEVQADLPEFAEELAPERFAGRAAVGKVSSSNIRISKTICRNCSSPVRAVIRCVRSYGHQKAHESWRKNSEKWDTR